MLPKITDIEIQNNIESDDETLHIGKSFLFDFEKGDFVVKDGKLVTIDGIEAIKMWITKVLKTEKGRFKIYEQENKELEYGINIEDLIIGQNYPQSFIEAELKREITTALTKHSSIDNLSDFNIERNNSFLKINFKVNLKSGESFEKEVNF